MNVKEIAKLISQLIAVVFGALTFTGISVDPEVQTEIQSQVGNLVNAIAGVAIIATALIGSIQSVWNNLRNKE